MRTKLLDSGLVRVSWWEKLVYLFEVYTRNSSRTSTATATSRLDLAFRIDAKGNGDGSDAGENHLGVEGRGSKPTNHLRFLASLTGWGRSQKALTRGSQNKHLINEINAAERSRLVCGTGRAAPSLLCKPLLLAEFPSCAFSFIFSLGAALFPWSIV